MDRQSAWEEIGHRVFLDQVERLLGDEAPPCREDHLAIVGSILQGLQDDCWVRSRFVERLWRVIIERWDAEAGGPHSGVADWLPERGELEEILQEVTFAERPQRPLSDARYLDAVEALLRGADEARAGDPDLAYGDTLLKLWSDQKIRSRFVECLWQMMNDSRRAGAAGGPEAAVRWLPQREDLERMLNQAAFEWVEERRRALAGRDLPIGEQGWDPALLSYS